MNQNELQFYNYTITATNGAAETFLFPLLGAVDFGGAEPSGIEVSIKGTLSGAGANPSLIVKVQTSPDAFSTAALTHDALAMTTLTATGQETKSVDFSSTVFQGLSKRLSLVADCDVGANASWTGFVKVIYYFR